MDSLYLAWKYLRFNKVKTLTIIFSVTVILSLPLILQMLVNAAESQLRSRAVNTPLLVGKRGSAMDLVLSSLYFTDERPGAITVAVNQQLRDTSFGQTIPILRESSAGGFPIIGTLLDYFDFRHLTFAAGRPFIYLGECVLGSSVAAKLQLKPGDSLFSATDNLFDLAGNYPLKMTVAGVLEESHSPDDYAVLVDLKTAWVIAGLGHGHADIAKLNDPSVILNRDQQNISANAKLMQYTEITPENRTSFHFHGDMSGYPLSSVIVIPHDIKSEALLKGRFVNEDTKQQVVTPDSVIDVLLSRIFQIKTLIDGTVLLVALSTLLALILVFSLSARLREREFNILFNLGCRSRAISQLLLAEIFLVLVASTLFCGVILTVIWCYRDPITRLLLF